MAIKKTASNTKKKAVSKTKKPAAKKPATKKPVKPLAKKKQGIKKGTKFSCEVCGLIISVDEVCGCVETCDILCCSEQMTKKK
ncbi:MAG: hypothetical protein RDU01_08435 [Thermodesulfovibrionales bacterium]|nr:hypothetical protein [Thermodesulfovibrionales bacterium]